MKTLIIGWREGNLADTVVDSLPEDTRLWLPGQDILDVSDPDTIGNYIKEWGPWDEVLYCAAVNELKWIKDINMDDLVHTYKVNVFGFVEVVARHVEFYPDHETRFVTVVSDSARTPMRGSLLYGSSKTALTGVIRNMARELAPKQTVVGVSPTVIDNTPMTDYIDEAVPVFRGWDPDKARAYEAQNIPMGRRLTKQEVADVIVFALGGPATLTGSIIEITGGK